MTTTGSNVTTDATRTSTAPGGPPAISPTASPATGYAQSMPLGDTRDAPYYANMASSLGDKERILEHLVPGSVVDVGSGGGVLAQSLRGRGHRVVGVDPYPQRVPAVVIHEGYADEVVDIAPPEGFDNVVACAVLHEVFSYGNRSRHLGRVANLSDALHAFRSGMRSGGRLIVRDGVQPTQGRATMTLREWSDADIERFLAESPFTRGRADREIDLQRISSGVWEGTASSVMECVFTLTWGEDAFAREVQEFYGVFSLEDYAGFVESHGFRLRYAEAYTQPEYVANLTNVLTLDGFDEGFPHTNAIWVYEAL